MGILPPPKLYDPKFINAEIDDASGQRHFLPIKNTIGGDYFLADIKGQLYCFKIDASSIRVYHGFGLKEIRFLHYDTSHYSPLNGHVKELELILRKNGLPRVNNLLSELLKFLGRKERDLEKPRKILTQDGRILTQKQDFTPHDIKAVIEHFAHREDEYGPAVRDVCTYLQDLGIEHVVTPVRRVSDFIEDDLKSTLPNFLGNIIHQWKIADNENKKITNTPIGPKTAWAKIIAVVAIVGLIGFIFYFGYEEGWFDSLTAAFDSVGKGFAINPPPPSGGTANDLMSRYSTPEELKAAIDRGEVKYSSLPPDVKKLVDGVKTPTVTPSP